MKKFKVIGKTFTKFYGYLASHYEDVFEAKNKQEAIEKSLRLSQEEILDQSSNTWDVDTFPMLIDCEEE